MSRKTIVVAGAGGVARELRWLIAEINRADESFDFLGFVVSDPGHLAETEDTDLLGDYRWLEEHRERIDCLAIGIGSPPARRRLSEELSQLLPEAEFPALVHPSVLWDRETSRLGEGAIVTAGVRGTVNLDLGPFALIGVGSTLGHEASVGRWSALNPGAILSGGVRVGEEVMVGSGATVLQYLSVGDRAVVGAGAVVTCDVAAGATVVGVPARRHDE